MKFTYRIKNAFNDFKRGFSEQYKAFFDRIKKIQNQINHLCSFLPITPNNFFTKFGQLLASIITGCLALFVIFFFIAIMLIAIMVVIGSAS